jgi:hypothetical protein
VPNAREGLLYSVTLVRVDFAGVLLAFYSLVMAYLLHIVACKLSIPLRKVR